MLLDINEPVTSPELVADSTCDERRLAANRANAQLSTGPRTVEGKAKSSLNAVKTGLTGHAILLADAEQADQYRAHLDRVFASWQPKGDREHTLVQNLANTQWRLNSIPGLESALYALARLRGVDLLTSEDPLVRRLLIDGQTEIAEAKALKNLRLQEIRLGRQYEKAQTELEILQSHRRAYEEQQARLAREQQKREQEERLKQQEEQEQREQAQKRAERRKARAAAKSEKMEDHPVLLDAGGFEFSSRDLEDENAGSDREDYTPETLKNWRLN